MAGLLFTQQRPFGSGSARLDLSQKDGLPFRCWGLISRFKAIDARMISVEAAMNAPRSPALPEWKIDLIREAIKIIEGEKRRTVTAAMISKRIPSLSMADIEVAMGLLRAQRRRERK